MSPHHETMSRLDRPYNSPARRLPDGVDKFGPQWRREDAKLTLAALLVQYLYLGVCAYCYPDCRKLLDHQC